MPTPARSRCVLLALAVTTALVAAGCSSGEEPAAEQAQARAQTGLLQSYSADYELLGADSKPTGSISVWRTPDRLRLDVVTGTGTSTSITTSEGTVACQVPKSGKKPTCLTVADAGEQPPPEFDPALRRVFGDVLRVLAAGDEKRTTVTLGAEDTTAGVVARCFNVSSAVWATPSASPSPSPEPSDDDEVVVPDGTYCLTEDGVPTRFDFGSSAGALTELRRTAPEGAEFEPTVSPTPLPTDS